MFSPAQYEALLNEIQGGLTTFDGNLDKIPPAAQRSTDHWYIPAEIKEAVRWIAHKSVEVGKELLNWFLDLLKGAVAPIYMFIDSWKWMDIRGSANGVSTNLTPQNLVIDDSSWTGAARDAYENVVGVQSAAAARIGSIASSTSLNLLACAGAGLAFYIVLAGVLAKLIAATIAAITAFGTGAFSWAGAAIILEEAGVDTAVIVTAVSTLAAFLAAQAAAMVTMHGDAVDPSSFPNGVWPKSNTSQYSDGTVKDGDADWSLKGN
jgi:hypothetical protein